MRKNNLRDLKKTTCVRIKICMRKNNLREKKKPRAERICPGQYFP